MVELKQFLEQPVLIATNDGRIIVGILHSFDGSTNVVLTSSHERIFSLDRGVQVVQLGLFLVRGDNIALIGDINEDVEAAMDYESLRIAPLAPIIH